jgi:lysozyme
MSLSPQNRGRVLAAALTLSGLGLVGIALDEDYRDAAYKPTPADVHTIGFGHTAGVKPGDKTTPPRALQALHGDVSATEAALKKCLGDIPMYQGEWDAFVSLAFNVGPGAVCASTIPAKLRAGNYTAACETIRSFNKQCVQREAGRCVKYVELPGLTKRRNREAAQCLAAGAAAAAQAASAPKNPPTETKK